MDIALQLWAYNTREIIGRGRSPRQLSQGCYMSITARASILYHANTKVCN